MQTMKAAAKSFEDTSLERYPTMEPGQARSKYFGHIGGADFTQPVEKLAIGEEDAKGNYWAAGSYKYESIRPNEPDTYARELLTISYAYWTDKAFVIESTQNLDDITDADFAHVNGVAQIKDSSRRKMSPELKTAFQNYGGEAGDLWFTRTYTPAWAALNGNLDSRHGFGSAADVRLKDKSDAQLEWLIKDSRKPDGWMAANGIRMWIEAEAGNTKYNELRKKYGNTKNQGSLFRNEGSGLHAHFEFIGQ